MTGDLAAGSAETNDFNAFTKVFESRYVSGVVAGLKLKSMIDAGTLTPENVPAAFDTDGNVKIGYVGAFNYAEVVSGYTAFYLGIKSVVDNVVMTVKYTNSWFDPNRESAAADYLMSQGCVIIGQHADSTGAPTAVQTKYEAGALYHFSVGYNVSMLDVAPDVALTSATNNWAVYYTELFTKIFAGEKPATDWAKGYADDAVAITALGTACAEGTADYVANVVASLKDGSLKVFDCSKFTKDGAHLTTYTDAWGMNGAECLKTENGVTFFDESTLRSAPYFDIRIDGITEEAADE
jgi:basic membrane protein A